MLLKTLYLWEGVDIYGQQKLGLESAILQNFLRKSLHKEGIYSIHTTVIAKSLLQKKLNTQEILSFLKAILSYLKIGLSLQEILPEVSRGFNKPILKYVTYILYNSLHQGKDLKVAFRKLSANFPIFFLATIQVSSGTQNLGKIFQDTLKFYETLEKRSKKIQQSLQYPLFVLCFTMTMVFLIIYFIIPMFESIYTNFPSGSLPFLTKIALSVSNFLHQYLFIIALVSSGLFIFHNKKWFSFLNPMTIFSYTKNIFQKKLLDTLIFSYALHNLLKHGTPLDQALRTTAEILTPATCKKVYKVVNQLHKGSSFYQACKTQNLYWNEFALLLVNAEKTGDLVTGMKNIYLFCDEQFESRANTIAKTLHLLVILFSGVIIFLLFLAIYLPLINLGSLGF